MFPDLIRNQFVIALQENVLLFNHVQQSPKAQGWHEFASALLNNSLPSLAPLWSSQGTALQEQNTWEMLQFLWFLISNQLLSDHRCKNLTWTFSGNKPSPSGMCHYRAIHLPGRKNTVKAQQKEQEIQNSCTQPAKLEQEGFIKELIFSSPAGHFSELRRAGKHQFLLDFMAATNTARRIHIFTPPSPDMQISQVDATTLISVSISQSQSSRTFFFNIMAF